jgi:hypothetical protein
MKNVKHCFESKQKSNDQKKSKIKCSETQQSRAEHNTTRQNKTKSEENLPGSI